MLLGMPGRFFGRRNFSRGNRLGSIVDSIKNEVNTVDAVVASTNLIKLLVLAKDTPVTATASHVKRGSKVFRIWVEFWYYGLSAGNTNDIFDAYIMKNPGANLTPPNPGTVGTSNEKKFVFKTWKGLGGNKSLGGVPYTWKGWIKIPKLYQRMGTDDKIELVVRSATTGNFCMTAIYKWFS